MNFQFVSFFTILSATRFNKHARNISRRIFRWSSKIFSKISVSLVDRCLSPIHGNIFDTKNTFRSSTSSINHWGEGGFIHKEVRSGSQGLLIKAVVPWNSNISYCGIWCSFHIAEGSSTDHVLSDWLFLRFHVHINAHPRQFPFCLPLQVEYTCVCMCVACLPPLTSIVNVFSVNFFLPFLSHLSFSMFQKRKAWERKNARVPVSMKLTRTRERIGHSLRVILVWPVEVGFLFHLTRTQLFACYAKAKTKGAR